MTLAKNGWHAFDPEPPGVHLVSCLASVNSSEEMSQQGESWEQILINGGQAVEALAVYQDKMESFSLFCSCHRQGLDLCFALLFCYCGKLCDQKRFVEKRVYFNLYCQVTAHL